MTMRDQIRDGLNAAMNTSEHTFGSDLCSLGEADQEMLIQHILAALATVPTDTPQPQTLTLPSETSALVISPADVVARYAADALDDVRHAVGAAPLTDEALIHETWAGGREQRQTRELVFRIQSLFGVRARSTASGFLVAGTPAQVRALKRVVMLLVEAAAPVVAQMPSEQWATFYATVGTIIAEHPAAAGLRRSNASLYVVASGHLSATFGPARNLDRATPASQGSVYEAALQVAPVGLPVAQA